METLRTALLELAREFEQHELRLILGGGLGLYLKQTHLERERTAETLIPGQDWFPPRATEDMDILLSTEIVADHRHMETVRRILDQLGYQPSVEFLQFAKRLPEGSVKVDLLTGPIPKGHEATVRVKRPRVRPSSGSKTLHAYLADDALGFETAAEEITLEALDYNGDLATAKVWILNPFTYLMMKLHALRDREERGQSTLAQKHALDVYRTVSMLRREDFDLVQSLVIENSTADVVVESRKIRDRYFSTDSSRGVVLLRTAWRDSGTAISPTALQQMLDALRELFSGVSPDTTS